MSGILLLRRRLYQGGLPSRFNQIRHYALIGKPNQNQKPVWSLPESPARTRFAPSPTGYLHLGSLRTALYNYLLAQATGGQFIIRLEDTDQTRFVEDAERRLYQDLKWAGLSWDEGPDKGGPFGPYKQSERLDLYREHASMLLKEGHAFRCFCSKEDLDFNLKEATSSGATAHYPGTCMGISEAESDRRAANGEPHIIRFKTAETPVSAPDLVYGAYKKAEREDNFIIMKSDGFPTYHFANVVDDHFMKITHVIRGAEWLISTPKHVELYNAFGWQPPSFAHVGLLVDHQRQKLSKRDIDNIGISVFRDTRILPEALLNFSVMLGWDPSLQNKPHLDKRGRLTLDEMKQNFTLKFTRGDIVVDLVKLKYFQSRFIRDLISGEVADPVALSTRILKPIQAELQRLDEDLSTSPEANGIVVGVDGNVSLSSLTVRRALGRTEDHIHQVLKAWKGPVDDPSVFVRDNMYAFWGPSKAAYRESFEDLQNGMRRIILTKGQKRIENTDISKVILYARNHLDEISEDQWDLETVGTKAKEIADAVEYYDTKKDQVMNHGAGWKFIRWGLFNGMSGLSVVPMMLLLGREESLKRLREARKTAAKEEQRIALAQKEEEQERRRARIRIAYLGKSSAGYSERDQADELLEPRNVKVLVKEKRIRKIPSKTEHFLRPTHNSRSENGPFVSQPPNREYAQNSDPTVQFLNQEEHKAGYRHLGVGEATDDSAYDPPLWQVIEKRRQAALARSQETTAQPARPEEGLGPLRAPHPEEEASPDRRVSTQHVGSDDNQPTLASSERSQTGPMLRPRHPKKGTEFVPERGPFSVGEPVPDREAHVKHLQALNAEKKLISDKRLRRERLKQARHDAFMEPIGGLPIDLYDSSNGPFYAGDAVYHPLRPQPQLMATLAKATEDKRRVQMGVDKEGGVPMKAAQNELKQPWIERGKR